MTTAGEGGPAANRERSRPRWYSSPSFWLGPFVMWGQQKHRGPARGPCCSGLAGSGRRAHRGQGRTQLAVQLDHWRPWTRAFRQGGDPQAGSYRVQVTDNEAGGLDSARPRRSAPGTGSGPEITLAQRPWSPLESDVLGAILAGLVVFVALLLLTLPFRLLI